MNQPAWAASLSPFVEQIRQKSKAPGVALGVAKDGEPIYFEAFGYRDAERQLPITPETLFGLASVSKSFTAIAIMQLQEAGKLRVDDPISRYLPEFRTPDPDAPRRTTLHHFMTHTAGFPGLPFLMQTLKPWIYADPGTVGTNWRTNLETNAGSSPIRSYEDLLQAMGEYPYTPLGAPGETMNYSNESFALLGGVIERVTGMPYVEYATKHILEPAEMTRTSFDPAILAEADITTLYDSRPQGESVEVFPSPIWWPEWIYQSCGSFLVSCVRDMLRYTEIFRTGGTVGSARILRPESVAAMTAPHIPTGPFVHYGYGLRIQPDFYGTKLVEHGGNLKGIASNITILPERGITAVCFSNLMATPCGNVNAAAALGEMGLPVDSPRFVLGEYACPSDQMQRYAGTYGTTEGLPFEIAVVDEGLEARYPTQTAKFRPVAPHVFASGSPGQESPVEFRVGADGRVKGLFMGVRYYPKQA